MLQRLLYSISNEQILQKKAKITSLFASKCTGQTLCLPLLRLILLGLFCVLAEFAVHQRRRQSRDLPTLLLLSAELLKVNFQDTLGNFVLF